MPRILIVSNAEARASNGGGYKELIVLARQSRERASERGETIKRKVTLTLSAGRADYLISLTAALYAMYSYAPSN